MPRKAIIAYVPVLHAGYKRLFDKHPEASIYVFDTEIIARFDQLRKELRALSPADVVLALRGWGRDAQLLTEEALQELARSKSQIVIPDEDVTRELVEGVFNTVTMETIFLRWDRRKMDAKTDPLSPDRIISTDELDQEMMAQAVQRGAASTNIYRRVGGVIAQAGAIILKASNEYGPTPANNWMDGDPRSNANRGTAMELSTDMHAEARMIAEAARKGISLTGAQLYVTTYPCPTCAKLVAHSGITKVYYAEGYAVLDGEEVLKNNGIELIQVEVNQNDDEFDGWVPYPEKKI